jgi:hypothetical protein
MSEPLKPPDDGEGGAQRDKRQQHSPPSEEPEDTTESQSERRKTSDKQADQRFQTSLLARTTGYGHLTFSSYIPSRYCLPGP